MTKFNAEKKMDAILRYQAGRESVKSIAKSLGVNHEVVRMWIKQFEYHGEKAFERTYTAYTVPYKLDVLQYMNENGTSPNEAAVIFNIPSPGIIRKWRSQFSKNGIDALTSKKKGRSSMAKNKSKVKNNKEPVEGSVEALQAEIERLRMENAYLKKLNTLIQNKGQSPNKTKHK